MGRAMPKQVRHDVILNEESPAFAGLSSFNSKNYFLAGAAGGVVAGALVLVLVLPALVFAFIFEVSVFVFSFCLACTGAAVTLPTMIAAANIRLSAFFIISFRLLVKYLVYM